MTNNSFDGYGPASPNWITGLAVIALIIYFFL